MNFWNVNIVGITQESQNEFSITVPSATLPNLLYLAYLAVILVKPCSVGIAGISSKK